MVPTRELYWHIDYHFLIYPLMFVSLCVFVYGFYRRYHSWQKGQSIDRRGEVFQRLKSIVVYGFGQKRILRESYPGIMHFLIFTGFMVLLIGTKVVGGHDKLGLLIFQGQSYLVLSLMLDIFGFFAIIGILMAVYRRYVMKPERLDNKPEDLLCLILILSILVTGFILEGLRIGATGDPWAIWSPVGYIVARGLAGVSTENMIGIYPVLWWGHVAFVFSFIALIPYIKLLHIFTSLPSLYLRRLEPKGALVYIDLEDEDEDEDKENYGIETLKDFTWKQLMDTDTCMRCGRCQEYCPAYLTQKPLSPKLIVQLIKQQLHIDQDASLHEKVTTDSVWFCTTCGACEEQCPVFVEHIDRTIGLRRNLVLMKNDYPPELVSMYKNMENNGNPWGIGWAQRADWTQDLGIQKLAEHDKVEYLYWIGCAGSYESRNNRVVATVSKILKLAGIEYGILGSEEKCCGDPARRTGNEYVYQILAQENIDTLNRYGIKKIITSCPHCYNVLKNEYPQLNGNFEVIHHTQLLKDIIKQRHLMLSTNTEAVTYHDSCYLGRINDEYDAPREVLQVISGLEYMELDNNKEKSFCCGAGGGRMWIEETVGYRINEKRTDDILQSGAKLVATACPYCLIMLKEGLETKMETTVRVEDISEIVLQALNKQVSEEARVYENSCIRQADV